MASLGSHAATVEPRKVKDFDPEDDAYLRTASSDESGSEEEDLIEDAGREHYVPVGKSRLREPERPTLDAKYGGVAVSRAALEEEDDDPFAPVDENDDDDPFATRDRDSDDSEEDLETDVGRALDQDVDDDEEINSDEALGERDVERFKHMKFRGSKNNQKKTTESEEEDSSDAAVQDGATDESDNESKDVSDIDMDDEEEDLDDISSIPSTSSSPRAKESTLAAERDKLRRAAKSAPTAELSALRPGKAARNADRAELRKAAESASTAGLASALSAGANADVKKGQAVKQQRQTFDRLLDARIKLQKGITAMNELSIDTIGDEEVKNAARSAEDAALALWSTIDSIRCSITSVRDGTSIDSSKPKRKRSLNPTRSTSSSGIWEHTTSVESQAQSHRRGILDKWHTKTQSVVDTAQQRGKLLQPAQTGSSRLTDVLETYLHSELTTLTSQSYSPSTQAFDDATFYQALLRDLISSRSAADSNGALTGQSALPQKLHVSGSKHKRVDTKASKGRKIRYTVHEKLQNFMASEDRNTWTDAARTEFFSSLLGNVNALAENEVEGMDEDVEEGAALRLFRS